MIHIYFLYAGAIIYIANTNTENLHNIIIPVLIASNLKTFLTMDFRMPKACSHVKVRLNDNNS